MRLVILILLLLFPVYVWANEVVQAVGYILTFIPGWQAVGYALIIGSGIYGADQARRKAAEDAEKKRQEYNAGLRARTVNRVATNAPHRIILGEARVGADIVAIFNYGNLDEYQYMVCIHAAHECEAIDEIYVAGKALGTLDSEGNVIAGGYLSSSTSTVWNELHSGTNFTLLATPIPGSLRVRQAYTTNVVYYTLSGRDVTVDDDLLYICSYDYISYESRIRVHKHLGGASDPVDAELNSVFPTKWPVTSVLRGYCYTVLRLNLNQPEFRDGIPTIEAKIRGAKLYDPRSSLTEYSANPALAIYYYLTSEMCGIPAADIPIADVITAANVCDESITIDGGSAARYTCNGTVDASQDPQKMLEQLAQCMAGGIVRSTWNMWAGKYVAPVMALSHSDIVGSWSTIGGTPKADLFNGVRGQYIDPDNNYVVDDFKPYQNAAYVTADGSELWTDITYPFTDNLQRVHNLARIACEDQRNGFTLKGVFSLKCWSLKLGQRVTFDSTLLGQSTKIYRVTNKTYSPSKGLELTLKEDAASIWDEADAIAVDATPNTDLPDAFLLDAPGNLQLSEELYETSGSTGVRSRVVMTWDAPPNVTIRDYVVEYSFYTDGEWYEFLTLTGTRCEFNDLAEGMYNFRVRAKSLLAISDWATSYNYVVYGLTAAPEDVTGFSVVVMNGVAYATWTKTTSLDVKIGGKVVIRFCPLAVSPSWEQSYILEEFNGDAVMGVVPLATGTYYAKFVDSTGHYSDTETSFVATEALVTGWSTVGTSTQHPSFTGAKSSVYFDAVTSSIRLSGSTLWDDFGLLDDEGYIDTAGGVALIGTYNFDATLDLGSVASRRFHAYVESLAYDTGDTIAQRGLVSTWPSVAGGVINDCDVTVLARVSEDDIVYGPWTPFMVADFYCRYAQFKAELASGVNTHNIQVSALSVSVKEPV